MSVTLILILASIIFIASAGVTILLWRINEYDSENSTPSKKWLMPLIVVVIATAVTGIILANFFTVNDYKFEYNAGHTVDLLIGLAIIVALTGFAVSRKFAMMKNNFLNTFLILAIVIVSTLAVTRSIEFQKSVSEYEEAYSVWEKTRTEYLENFRSEYSIPEVEFQE